MKQLTIRAAAVAIGVVGTGLVLVNVSQTAVAEDDVFTLRLSRHF